MAKTKIKNYRDFRKEMQQDEIHPAYLISGEEDYLIDHAVRMLKKAMIQEGSETLDLVNIKNKFEIDKIIGELQSIPFISQKRLIFVYNSGLFNNKTGSSADKQDYISQIMANLHDQNCICFLEDKVDKRLKKNLSIFKEKGGAVYEIDKESSSQLQTWLANNLARAKINITREAAESLILRCDLEMGQLVFEIDKLIKYCAYSDTSIIDNDLLDFCCREDLQGNIFKLTDALSDKNFSEALGLLDKLFKQGEPPILILFMIARHIRQLLCSKFANSGPEISRSLKVPPFVGNRLYRQAQRFSVKELKTLCKLCFQTDKNIKTGDVEERLGLEMILLEATC